MFIVTVSLLKKTCWPGQVRNEAALEGTHSQRPASERANLQLWNFLHACLQCDPLKRPEHDRVRGVTRETETESESESTSPAQDLEAQHKSIDWSRVLSTALQPGDVVGADRYSFPLADGLAPGEWAVRITS